MSTSLAYDADRVERIGRIMPTFLDVAQPGDEIYKGLLGDPAFPEYRGSRPTGVVESVTGERGYRCANLRMSDGSLDTYHEGESAAQRVFEFTESGYQKILAREEAEAARYRAASRSAEEESSRPETRLVDEATAKKVETMYRGMQKMERRINECYRSMQNQNRVLVHISNGLARDLQSVYRQVSSLSSASPPEPLFAGTLLREMSQFRGSTTHDDVSSIVSSALHSSANFSDDDGASD